jgi:hypothetical protein
MGIPGVVLRVNADGTTDATFANCGFTATAGDQRLAILRAVVLQADGKLVAAGTAGGIYDDSAFEARFAP